MAHVYRSCQPEDISNAMTFEILGFDILIDNKLKPYLLEVNHSPSFITDTPLDKAIKRRIITDTLTLLNISVKNKKKLLKKNQEET